jgi:hypothetical protein
LTLELKIENRAPWERVFNAGKGKECIIVLISPVRQIGSKPTPALTLSLPF